MPNIRLARVTEAEGEVVLELEGIEENLEKGIQFLRDQEIHVEDELERIGSNFK